MTKIRGKMLEEQRRPKQRRPAEGSPSDTNVTEGLGVGTSADSASKYERNHDTKFLTITNRVQSQTGFCLYCSTHAADLFWIESPL